MKAMGHSGSVRYRPFLLPRIQGVHMIRRFTPALAVVALALLVLTPTVATPATEQPNTPNRLPAG
jgi:hypothetical protein